MIPPTARRWLYVDGDAPPPSPSTSLRVVTLNTLAPRWATPTAFPGADPAALVWDGPRGRRARLIEEVDRHGADVLCLQEVDPATLADPDDPLAAALAAAGYTGAHFAEEGAKRASAARPGPALLWRAALFDVVAGPRRARLGRTPFADALPRRHASTRALRGTRDGAVVAGLRHRGSGALVVAASAHLFWDPRAADVKALQAASLASVLADAAARLEAEQGATGVVTVVCGGDFNALPVETAANTPPGCPCCAGRPSGVYELLATGELAPGHPHHPARFRGGAPVPLTDAGLGLLSARAAAGGEPPATTRTAQFVGVLDYVWVSRRGRLRAVGWLEDPAPAADAFDALPDAVHPSDHVAVGVVLKIVEGETKAMKEKS